MSFAGKVVVVTGASTGIGQAIALLFAKEGAEVALVARNEERLQKVAQLCDAHGKKALIVKADFSKEAEISSVVPKVIERFGKIDVLVNNAGTYKMGKILDGSIGKAYDEVMMVNLTAPIVLTTEAAPHLVKTKGSVVNISSVRTYADISYGVSKAGLDHFTRAAAFELGASGVRVNSLNPGAVNTEAMNSFENAETLLETVKKSSLLGKMIESEEVAEFTLFLASEKAKSITGENYNFDNGNYLKAISMFDGIDFSN